MKTLWMRPTAATQTATAADDWSDLSNIYVQDQTYASSTNSGASSSETITASDFNFDIPVGAIITGVEVRFLYYETGIESNPTMQLVVGGSATGDTDNSLAVTNEGIPSWYKYGSASSDWSTGLTRTQAVASDFGVDILVGMSSGGGDQYIDVVEMRVHYIMPISDRTKYDVNLDGQGWRTTTLSKDSAPDFVPRFNTGAQGENDLDLLKSKHISTFAGGMLQTEWHDDGMVAVNENVVYNPIDDYLYPAPEQESYGSKSSDNANANTQIGRAYAYMDISSTKTLLYTTYQYLVIGSGGMRNDIESDGTTLPTALRDANQITDMYLFGGVLYIGTGSLAGAVNIYEFDGSSYTVPWSNKAMFFAEMGDRLYKINNTSNLNIMNTSAYTVAGVGTNSFVGDSETEPYFMETFQNRIYVGKPEGLFAYDGVQIYKVLDLPIAAVTEFEGWLYMRTDKVLYRFNGITLEKLYDFVDVGDLKGRMVTVGGRVWLTVEYLKEFNMGGKFGDALATTLGVFYYDGVGLFQYDKSAYNTNQIEDYSTTCGLMTDGTDIMLPLHSTAQLSDAIVQNWDLSDEFDIATVGTSFQEMSFTTSVFNGSYPNVVKTMDAIEVDFKVPDDTDVKQYGTISVSYSDKYGVWTDFETVATITDKFGTRIKLDNPIEFHEMQIKFTADSSNDHIAVRRLSFRYTLQPERRWRWAVGLLAMGADKYNHQTEIDGVVVTETPKKLREKLYAAHRSKTAVFFTEVDYTAASGTHNSTVLTINVDSTDTFPESGLIRINNELIRYEEKTSTQFLKCTRGVYNTTAASHADDDLVEPVYRVFVNRVTTERYELDENTTNTYDPTLGLETEILVELIEV